MEIGINGAYEILFAIGEKYSARIYELLDNEELPLFLREQYSESPHWYTNGEWNTMLDTLIWMSYTDNEKKKLLDEELDTI